jgi:hypothetical protein
VTGPTIRGDALLASVKRGGGPYRGPDYATHQLAAGSVVLEAVLRGVLSIEHGRLRPGSVPGEGALEELARQVREEPKPQTVLQWLRWTGPAAQRNIERELEEAGLARGWTRRILLVYRQPRLDVLDQSAQEEAYRTVRETFLGERPIVPEDALLLSLLSGAGVLQYHFRTTRGRRNRAKFRDLRAALPAAVESGLDVYLRWNPGEPS